MFFLATLLPANYLLKCFQVMNRKSGGAHLLLNPDNKRIGRVTDDVVIQEEMQGNMPRLRLYYAYDSAEAADICALSSYSWRVF